MREIKLSMAIASCLSDAQHEIKYGTKELMTKANQRMNYVKSLVFDHNDLNEYVTTDYLDKVWEECCAKYK